MLQTVCKGTDVFRFADVGLDGHVFGRKLPGSRLTQAHVVLATWNARGDTRGEAVNCRQ